MKLAYCILVCAFLKLAFCLQKPANLVDDESFFDVQRGPSSFASTDKNYLRFLAMAERNIVQCVFCNFMLLNKYMIGRSHFTKDRLIQCSYYSPERCLSYFESYLNETDADKTNKRKRQFDEIDKTDPGFSTLNQIH
ncbi:uncharacterized protein LOC129919493 [Episyrphus balteatus]|uniref:uncharacterized protein LOC129919493 n=1 Tax=Episyrphus balteatus TaxID=286459 RepID=UPI0024861582|nr:uncharacterized protein LOC129919493 [Episyrphus balteatus]XP_055856363.1 uncharacterized protein LOC129919493 [Episyrphus balteatus]